MRAVNHWMKKETAFLLNGGSFEQGPLEQNKKKL
jgi:hypothetical protein